MMYHNVPKFTNEHSLSSMADLCTSVLLAGIITFVLFYFLSWINKETIKVVKKIRGKPDEPIECKISKIVSYCV